MAANSNMGFHHGTVPISAFDRQAIMFQSGAINSSTGLIPMGNSSGMNSAAEMIFPGNSCGMNNMVGVIPSGSSGSGLLLDTVPGLKHDSGLAVDWSIEEQSLLEKGLAKFSDEPNIMPYVKIAATLRDKTVRDVALRCRWMTKKDNGKRRKPEDPYTGKKMKDRKEKRMDSLSKTNIPPPLQPNMPPNSFVMPQTKHNDRMSYGVPAIGGTTRHLLDENTQIFSQISANLESFKIHENIDLFCRSRNNIMAILNEMRDMPGIMSHMPPLPVPVNEELANLILASSTAQGLMFSSHFGIHLKQDPRC
ncbi:uncharacterized protein LOC143886806 [Tasmannia lanceolata]|uniref:uncharacterized protein LOC143886806 n=1 Tax=Tasmannia lanceolata TaxID=3420 RepID=UPI0040635565